MSTSPHLTGATLHMIPGPTFGSWIPETAEDRRIMRQVLKPRPGDLVNSSALPVAGSSIYRVGHLIAVCADRGVIVRFEPVRPGVRNGKASAG
jgi:hypothetical protein